MQNINIVYKVDKGEVDKSNAAVERAKQLTDQLKNASKQFTDQATKGNKEFVGSIEGLKLKMAQLRAQIDLTSRSDSARLNKLVTEYKQVKQQVDEFNKSLKDVNRTQQEAANSSKTLASGFMSMYNGIKMILAAGLVRELVDMTLDMAKLAGQTETVGRAFHKQIPNAESLLYRLRQATKGTVSDMELMQRSLKFQNFGADVQQLPALLEFAAVRAQQTGDSVDYLVNSIVNGIGRKSILVLDNLGISATRLKEELGGVSTQAATVGQVTEAVARVASSELEKMGGFAQSSATQVDQLAVAWSNLGKTIAKEADEGGLLKGITDVFKGAIDALSLGVEAMSNKGNFLVNLDKLVVSSEMYKLVMQDVERVRKESLKTDEDKIDYIQQEINSRVQSIGKFNDGIKALREEKALIADKNPYDDRIDQINSHIKAMNNNRLVLVGVIRQLIAYRDELQNQSKAETEQIRSIRVLRDELDELQKQREEATSIFDTNELDRLQRLINLKEEEILKVSDSIKYYQYWDDISKQVLKTQEEINKVLNERNEGDAMKFFEKLVEKWQREAESAKNFKMDVPVEIEPEIIIPEWDAQGGWQGGNEKMARFRLAMKEWFKENQEEIIGEGISFTSDLLQMAVDAELASYDRRLDNLRNYYDQAITLAGDNERYKKEIAVREHRDTQKLERERAQAQKKARLYSIAIDTAASIARAWVNPGYPGAIPLTIFLAAQGATQAAIVNRQPAFKDGVIDLKGPGTSTSDSIQARLSKGESVMTAAETQSSYKTLKMIRAKKLNDKVIERLARSATGSRESTFDDSRLARIMSEVAKNTASSDLVQKGTVIYETKKYSDNLKAYIKSKY